MKQEDEKQHHEGTRLEEIPEHEWVKRKIRLGICVMDKKARSDPMQQILDRLDAFGEFEIVVFGDKMLLEEPIESWPNCNALIAFHSTGYPMEKAIAYTKLRKPFLVNQLESQHLLHDRRKVYRTLEEYGLPTPNYAVVNRNFPGEDVDYFVEDEDFVEVKGKRINKPFVEKPVDGDDHSVMIYYPSSAGGGMKELFRKVGNRSSSFHPDVCRVRRSGSFIYEEFMPTGGTDVKVYTVGPDYAHAEARKSPVLDGVVMRSADGKEIRYPVLLTPFEKEIARVVSLAFGQTVCGFDLLRSQGKSYICDVNGWSFVKNSHKYYDDAACVLREILIMGSAPHLYSPLPTKMPWDEKEPSFEESASLCKPQYNSHFGSIPHGKEQLRCVIAIIRHGDRTPKEKVKLKVTQERLLALMMKYNKGKPKSEAKLKSAVQLQDLLDTLRLLVPNQRQGRDSDSEADDYENSEKLRNVKAVLEVGGYFSGIYRKAQLKPQKWASIPEDTPVNGEDTEESLGRPTEALMVLKYGGVLTHAGRKQAEELGRSFRMSMYPVEAGEGSGLIRLHSTYRHDLKIYSSDEGRVQMSAAAFTKGLLDLEGPLTPILVSLVSKDSSMLDGLDSASEEMDSAKKVLYKMMTSGEPRKAEAALEGQPWMVDGGGVPETSLEKLKALLSLVKEMKSQLLALCKSSEDEICPEDLTGNLTGVKEEVGSFEPVRHALTYSVSSSGSDPGQRSEPCGTETFQLMFARWKKLSTDLYNERKDRFDISKVPDIYDCAKYDLVHNQHLRLSQLDKLYHLAKELADGVVPNEYGINPQQKLAIGSKVARKLLGKIMIDLRNTVEDSRKAEEQLSSMSADSQRPPKQALAPSDPACSSSRSTPLLTRNNSRASTSNSEKEEEEEARETPYRLHPLYANVRSPQQHVRTRLYFTSESHLHSFMNVVRYSFLEEGMAAKDSILSDQALRLLFELPEFDYLTHVVLRMYENTQLPMSDPEKFRLEFLFSPGAAHSPLERIGAEDSDHVLPVKQSELLPLRSVHLSFEHLREMLSPFAMPAEDFPPPVMTQQFPGDFSKGGRSVIEKIANLWPFSQFGNGDWTYGHKNKEKKGGSGS